MNPIDAAIPAPWPWRLYCKLFGHARPEVLGVLKPWWDFGEESYVLYCPRCLGNRTLLPINTTSTKANSP